MIKTPQNKGIILVALGAVMIISLLLGHKEMAYNIMIVFITLVNPSDTPSPPPPPPSK